MSRDLALACFWLCFSVVTYVYVGYPLLLCAGAFGKRIRAVPPNQELPHVSVIVPAHNEERTIKAKIENLLASGYPREKLEILIGNDGSDDATEDLVRGYADQGVGLVSFPQQHGKSAIQNGLAPLAGGEILVFTDADCFFPPAALPRLIARFANPAVGLVTGRPVFENAAETNTTRNEGFYLRYETWLRRQESERGLLAMASGSLFAVRSGLWRPVDVNLGDDFALPLAVIRAGFRNKLEPDAVATTRLTQKDPRAMFRMKVRIIAKDFRALLAYRDLLHPLLHGGAAAGLWSHKLLRWLVPYFLLAWLATNVFLASTPLYTAILSAQAAFYALAAAGVFYRGGSRPSLLSVPASFCVVNAAALLGTMQCVAGRTFGRWTPAREPARTPVRLAARGGRT